MDIAELGEVASRLLAKGLANATQKTYLSGQQRYLRFCESGDRTPAPASEETLVLFVSHLAKEGLGHCAIKAYLAAVR